MDSSTFNSLPGHVIAYWVSNSFINVFYNSFPLSKIAEPKKGLSTGNNDLFLRLWFEVNNEKENFNSTDYINAFAYGSKWFPINKGGSFRKWYGNNEYVINYENNGKALKAYKGSVIRNETYYFNESITWSMLSSNALGMRYSPNGKLFEGAGPSLFVSEKDIKYVLGLVSSKVSVYFVKALNPTLNINIADIGNIPVILSDNKKEISDISEQNIELSKEDWDSFEESWDFKKHPLV